MNNYEKSIIRLTSNSLVRRVQSLVGNQVHLFGVMEPRVGNHPRGSGIRRCVWGLTPQFLKNKFPGTW